MRVTIYIKKEDEQLWQVIGNKSQWVSDQLNGSDTDIDRRIRRIVKEEVAQEFDNREQGY